MIRLRYGLICLLALLPVAIQAESRVEIFTLENRQSAEILPQLKALYPDAGAVFTADGQQLMVNADEAVLREVANLVKRLDVAPAQMRITLRREHLAQREGSARILSTRSGQSSQSIVVQDGETARIESGSIRQVTRMVQGGDSIALIAEETPMTEGFLVQPRALGNAQVELRVASFNNTRAPHRALGSDRDTAAVLTLRRVTPGEWVTLGTTSDESALDHGGRTYSTNNNEAQRWSIKVDFLE